MRVGPTESFPTGSRRTQNTQLDLHLFDQASTRSIGALTTIKRSGEPQISSVNFCLEAATGVARMSLIDDRPVVRNLRRDPRASIVILSPDGWSNVVLEGTVELSPVALTPDDEAVDELIHVFRAILGVDHPNWDDYRAAMVCDHRLVARLHVEHAYGIA